MGDKKAQAGSEPGVLNQEKGILIPVNESSGVGDIVRQRTKHFILLLLLFLLGCAPRGLIKTKPQLKSLRFQVAEVKAEAKDSVKNRNSAQITSLRAQHSEEITELLTRYSTFAFLRPRALSLNGAAPLEQFFAAELEEDVARDWQALSLGEESSLVSRAEKGEGKIRRLWIYYGDDLSAVIAVADFGLTAVYELKDGTRATLKTEGSFVFEPEATDSWQITGYRTKLELKSKEKKSAWKACGGELY